MPLSAERISLLYTAEKLFPLKVSQMLELVRSVFLIEGSNSEPFQQLLV